MTFCQDGWFDRTLGVAPVCVFEVGGSAVLLILALVTFVWTLRVCMRLKTRQLGVLTTVGPSAYFQLLLSYILLASHVLLLLEACLAHPLAVAPITYHAVQTCAWALLICAQTVSIRQQLTPQFRIFTTAAAVIYGYILYIHVVRQLKGKASGVVDMVQLSMAVAAVVALGVIQLLRSSAMTDEHTALRQLLLHDVDDEPRGMPAKKKLQGSWVKLFAKALMYVWPTSLALQLRAMAAVVLIVAIRVVNLLVPILYKAIVDRMAEVSAATHPQHGAAKKYSFMDVFYPVVLAYLIALFFQGGGSASGTGLLSNLRQYLWIPISQDSYRRITLDMFAHMLDLDLSFHLHRKTGELQRIMDRGTNSMQNILSTLVFSIGPQMFDIIAGGIYMSAVLEPWIAIIVVVTTAAYIPVTVAIVEYRGSLRRTMNFLDNRKAAKVTDALLNYETIKYFTNEDLECDNFAGAIKDYQNAEYKMLASLSALNGVQFIIQFAGIASGLAVCTNGVAKGSLTVGDAVLFLTLVAQLYAPLNYFGSYYRIIQQYFIDMENLFDLLATNAAVQDAANAATFQLKDGTIDFDGVTFIYDREPVLRNITMQIPGGKTVALVGATGSGKSTTLRLLFRFYDPTSGVVRIDGQPLTGVTQASVRRHMAVVPQDTVLFNESILFNIRYGRPDASDEEVHQAARDAAIHDIIMSRFPEQYATTVGERGLRLSGGEKQRVAFARALLKNPPILLLDEATSALDTITEQQIQDALVSTREQRTTVIVAHRLSTIVHADTIIVMQHGEIAEQGHHAELLQRPEGLYAALWRRQQENALEGDGPASPRSPRTPRSARASALLLQRIGEEVPRRIESYGAFPGS